jgi:hypothetical protein
VILARLLGVGAIYGLTFMIVKSLFPTPLMLLLLQGEQGSEGNLTLLVLVYMAAGLVGGIVAAPLFGLLLLGRKGGVSPHSSGARLVLSLGLSLLMGVISALLILLSYATGLLQSGGVLDPLKLIQSSNFPTGTPFLVAWTIARDLLPAGLAGLFLAPIGGGMLVRLYSSGRAQRPRNFGESGSA